MNKPRGATPPCSSALKTLPAEVVKKKNAMRKNILTKRQMCESTKQFDSVWNKSTHEQWVTNVSLATWLSFLTDFQYAQVYMSLWFLVNETEVLCFCCGFADILSKDFFGKHVLI